MLSCSPASSLMYPHAVSCLSLGTLRNLSKLVCLVTGKLENKHFGKDYFSVTVYRSYQALLKLTDTSAKRIATHFPRVQASVILAQISGQKAFSFQLLLMRNFSVAPRLRCCVKTTGVIHKIDAAPAQLSPINLLSWASTLLWQNIFWCHKVILGLAKRKFPRRCKEPEAAPASNRTMSSLSIDPDEGGSIRGLAKEALRIYPMLLTAEQDSDTCSNPVPWGWESSLPSAALPLWW